MAADIKMAVLNLICGFRCNTTKEFPIAFYVEYKKKNFHTGFILSLI